MHSHRHSRAMEGKRRGISQERQLGLLGWVDRVYLDLRILNGNQGDPAQRGKTTGFRGCSWPDGDSRDLRAAGFVRGDKPRSALFVGVGLRGSQLGGSRRPRSTIWTSLSGQAACRPLGDLGVVAGTHALCPTGVRHFVLPLTYERADTRLELVRQPPRCVNRECV